MVEWTEAGSMEGVVEAAASVLTSEYGIVADLVERSYVPKGAAFAVGDCVRTEDISVEFETRCPRVLVSVDC